eukprot:m.273675 g.273675  ORF g.273675 m.273675 type:complete len:55 (+) comp65108_c0_seq1:228-392(+)
MGVKQVTERIREGVLAAGQLGKDGGWEAVPFSMEIELTADKHSHLSVADVLGNK